MQERDSFFDEDAFWTAHIRCDKKGNKRRMNQTELLKVIRVKRARINQADADKAKAQFVDTAFAEKFSYKKTGKTHVLTKTADIAKQYRKLTHQSQYWDDDDETVD